ncbi:protein MIZU-KUSSEI 1-like [Typha angustifolia]|uniref:protein MIZU-KUSSEI 1-like n=1 Tax=Typha angustifolia TaxID=59011 RepID=UPI003C2D7FB3
MKKTIDNLRRSLFCCFSTSSSGPTTTTATATTKSRLSFSFSELFHYHHHHQEHSQGQQKQEGKKGREEPQEEESLLDPAASDVTHDHHHSHRHHSHHHNSVIVGTLFGHRRRGHRVSLCVQRDPSTPPPFLFDLPIPTPLLALEMRAGLLRIALECHRHVWRAYLNGRKLGYAVRRRPTDRDRRILEMVRTMTAGAGVLSFPGGGDQEEVIYMRACYERVVGSRDSVSYHLIDPGSESPAQELSVFLLRTG